MVHNMGRKTSYLVVYSRHRSFKPGDILIAANRGEVWFLDDGSFDGRGRPAIVAIRLGVLNTRLVVLRLLKIYDDSKSYAKITGINDNEIRLAIIKALKRIAAALRSAA